MERVSEAFGLLAFFIALLFFLAEAPAAVYSWQYIASTDPSLYIIIPFPTDPFTVSLVVALCVALLLLFLLSNFMPGRMKVRSFDGPAQSSFYSVFAAFVLLQLVVSVIIRFDDPPSLGYSPIDGFITPPAQVFYDASTTLVETLLLQAVPVTVIMVVYALARREKVSEALLNPRLSFWGAIALSSIAALVPAYFSYPGVYSALLGFITFLILDYIYLRYGMIRSFAVNFTITAINTFDIFIERSPVFAFLSSFFILLWAFIGLFALFSLASRGHARAQVKEEKASEARMLRGPGQHRQPCGDGLGEELLPAVRKLRIPCGPGNEPGLRVMR